MSYIITYADFLLSGLLCWYSPVKLGLDLAYKHFIAIFEIKGLCKMNYFLSAFLLVTPTIIFVSFNEGTQFGMHYNFSIYVNLRHVHIDGFSTFKVFLVCTVNLLMLTLESWCLRWYWCDDLKIIFLHNWLVYILQTSHDTLCNIKVHSQLCDGEWPG